MCNISPLSRQYNAGMESGSTPNRPCPPRHRGAAALLGLAAASALFAASAKAASLGEISLHSRIGEELLAEIPFTAGEREIPDAACFSLQAMPGADLPVVSNARIRLVRNKAGAHLLLIGSRPLSEPVFTISLHVNCGIDLQRTYVLMPEAPLPSAAVARAHPPERDAAPAVRNSPAKTVRAAAPAKQARQAKADKRLARRQLAAAPATGKQESRPPRPVAKPAPQGDRLVLGTTPLEFGSGDDIPAAGFKLGELEQRLLKMETSLSDLNREMDALHSSLTLSTEMQTAKRELQLAQTLQQPALAAAVPVASDKRNTSAGNWLQLLLSMLLGGLLTAGLAQLLTRRHPLRTTAAGR